MRRKKISKLVALVTVLTVSAMLFVGCGSNAEQTVETVAEDTTVTEAAADEETTPESFTVTFYDSDATTVLQQETVNAGETVKEFTPEKEGYVFAGWFGTPQMSHVFDFSSEITKDTDIFAGFVSYVEDTRTWYIVGSGTSPILMESNWGKVTGDAQLLTKEENEQANVYTITLDLNKGDEFQFAINSSWNHQRGYGYLDTISKDGEDYFANSGSLGEASSKRSNMKCAVAGNYTFTLTTYPGEDTYETENANYSEDNKEAFNINPYDKITWTYNGESKDATEDMTTDYYIKGAIITGWKDVYTDETKFVEKDGIYTLTIDLEEGDEFMFTSMVTVGETSSVGTEYIRYTNIASDDTESLSYVTGTSNANLIAGKAGSYTFTYDPSTTVLTVSVK